MNLVKKVLWFLAIEFVRALGGSIGSNAGLAVALLYLCTLVGSVVWCIMWLASDTSYELNLTVLCLLGASVLMLVMGYVFNRPEKS